MKMSSVAVFVFLLENLAGFNDALNDTLFQNAKYIHSDEASPVIHDCDPVIADQILSAVSQDLDLVIEPSVRRNGNEQSDEQASELFGRVLVDNSLPDPDVSRSFDENKSKFDHHLTLSSRRSSRGRENTENVTHKGKPEFPNSAPFLVAIFETLANVTAQTCAGTLLTPRWVLTAANCINVLSNLDATNTTNRNDTSHYTIVAESSNPLLDGSAHKVTSIVLRHVSNSSRRAIKEEEDMDGSYLALMRIEPEVDDDDIPALELMKEEVVKGDVMAYGWILSSKNDSDPEHDAMEWSSALSQIQSPAKCQTMYSYKDNDVLCLFSKDVDRNVTQLSTGGPVLIVHGGNVKMIAAVQMDDDVFVSYPVAPHHAWILHTISNK